MKEKKYSWDKLYTIVLVMNVVYILFFYFLMQIFAS